LACLNITCYLAKQNNKSKPEILAAKIFSLLTCGITNLVYNQILFTNILRLLEEQGVTKHELAIRANISDSFLSDLTNGKANPSLKVMEAIAEALETSLPLLLELTDLDKETLDELAGGKAPRSLPDGFVRISAIVTEYQAFRIRQWDQANKETLKKYLNPKKKSK
jgi:transcriptional regulator with XRE-family HTH domain